MASTSTSTSTSTTTRTSTTSDSSHLNLSANFANNPQSKPPQPSTIGYDHEVYLQLMAGGEKSVEKTANQVYREERALRRTTRALDPAILEPQGEPSPIDFECAESEGVKERLR